MMSHLVIRDLVRAHGVTGRAIACLAFVWVVAALSTGVLLPRIRPAELGESAPLELLGIALHAAVAAVQAAGLSHWDPDQPRMSPRRGTLMRVVILAVSLVPSLAFGAAVFLATAPWGMFVPMVGVWCLFTAVGVAGLVWLPRTLAVGLPVACALVWSTPQLVPWDFNVVYNEALATVRAVGSPGVLGAALAAYVLRGPRHGLG